MERRAVELVGGELELGVLLLGGGDLIKLGGDGLGDFRVGAVEGNLRAVSGGLVVNNFKKGRFVNSLAPIY